MNGKTRVGTIIIAAVCIVLCGEVAPAAQNASTVDERVRAAMLAQEPGWTLQPRQYFVDELRSKKKPRSFTQEWLASPKKPLGYFSEGVHLTILYEELPSEADAAAWMDKLRQSMPAHQSLTDIGDQAIMYGPKSDWVDHIEVFFIKGKAKVAVGGPSRMRERIAKMVAAQIY